MSNPFEEKINVGMKPIVAFLTDMTCGEACWHASGNECHCCCGGKNHGIMLNEGQEQPKRTAKIDGHRYELKEIGIYKNLYHIAKKINTEAGYKAIHKVNEEITYHYHWNETDRGAPARLKPASKAQIESWKELQNIKFEQWEKPYLLWVKIN